MLDQLEKKIRHIQVFSTKVVNELLAGEYKSIFKGCGMEFNEVREYQPGDEIRSIDWKITAKVGRPFVKRYNEEREQTLFFLIDLSSSGQFGTDHKTKNEIAVELFALLGFSAVRNNDKVGVLAFTDQVELFIPPVKGNQNVLRVIRQLLNFKPAGTGTNIAKALDYFGRLHSKRSILFLVSDFQDSSYEKELTILANKHDLIAVSISDPAEELIPLVGLVSLQDTETGEIYTIDTSPPKIRATFLKNISERNANRSQSFQKHNIDEITIYTSHDLISELIKFFKTRHQREQYG